MFREKNFSCLNSFILLKNNITNAIIVLSALFLGTMVVHISKLSFSRLALLLSALLASQARAGKTSRRFLGLPESGERIKYSNASEDSKTLIIRHDLPVSHR